MRRNLAHVTFLVQDYNAAIAFFTRSLAFRLIGDTPLADGKRWVLVAPAEGATVTLLLAKARHPNRNPALESRRETGGSCLWRPMTLFATTPGWRLRG